MEYFFVFLASLLVDIVPFIGPPAWTVMVFFQIRYGLDIWLVLVLGVAGSAFGRYILSLYMPVVFGGVLSEQKKQDIQFIGEKLSGNSWRVRLFALLYTLIPLPSTPLFTAAGMARVGVGNIIPSFIVGKFISDMVMVLTGDYAARNAIDITEGLVTWKSVSGVVLGVLILLAFFCIDWRYLLQNKRLRFDFRIWK
ncbi:hypothetical protein GCM10023093_31330 [Nemorincola caseinilytica]|uniref:DedA family protein n=1 Tax=Nemorincola caseinilytica TaxID=2054315 RepID=A0ABP8NST7_9BACT